MNNLNGKVGSDNEFLISSTSSGGYCVGDGEWTSHLTRNAICCSLAFVSMQICKM